MKINSLSTFIQNLETAGELVRIKQYVNPELEITEIAERMMKQSGGGKALLFENTGTAFPLLINHYGSDFRLFTSLGIKNYDEPGERIDRLFKKLIKADAGLMSKLALLSELKSASQWMPKKLSSKGKCQEVVIQNPDLNMLPILKCWPHDGGKFITLPMVISHDPETGVRNTGMYRMQIFDSKTTGMHWHLHKGGAAHFEKYKALGKIMPISVALGGDPSYTFCATAPLPENIDEFMLAGFLKNQSVKLVKSITNDIYVPENADFVLEGYVDPKENFKTEGPFGDHTGFYSLADEYPIFHLTCITHRKDAVYPATIVGVPPMEDFYLGKATERIFLKPIQISIAPEIMDFRLPSFGVAHNLVLIKAKTHYAGQSIKIMNSLLGAGQMMFSKVIVCFDESIDIQNDSAVFSALLNNVNFSEDIVISRGPTDVLDHSSYKFTYGGKLLIDATQKAKIEKAKVSKLDLPNEIGVLFEESGFCIIGADKKTKGNLLIYGMTLVENQKIENIKVLVIVNDFIRLYDKYLLAWYVLNNIDPSKDCKIHNGVLIVDASIKTKIDDDFNRLWPNPVTMDLGTIENADKIWKSLFPNKFIESPSKRIFGLIRGDSAVAEENHKSQMTMSLS